MSSYEELGRPSRRLGNAVNQIEIALEDVDEGRLKESLQANRDQLERIRVEVLRREGGSP